MGNIIYYYYYFKWKCRFDHQAVGFEAIYNCKITLSVFLFRFFQRCVSLLSSLLLSPSSFSSPHHQETASPRRETAFLPANVCFLPPGNRSDLSLPLLRLPLPSVPPGLVAKLGGSPALVSLLSRPCLCVGNVVRLRVLEGD